jgi:polysaccharide biosynthesis/export protein
MRWLVSDMTIMERCVLSLVLGSSLLIGQQTPAGSAPARPGEVSPVSISQPTPADGTPVRPDDASQYELGPDDQIKIWALGVEEISDKPVRIGPGGDIDLPLVGRIHAGGLTVEQFKSALLERLAKEVRKPEVSVDIVEFGSQPVSVMGAVNHPGIHQLAGRKSVAEVLALAGGLRPDAGPYITITRQIKYGPIPLPTTHTDPSGRFSTAQLQVKDLLSAARPAENILIRPHDVITVPEAESIYVVGAVRKPGAFPLNQHESVSVLQALSMAEGLGSTPAPQDSKILRIAQGSGERKEIPVDLKKVMAGKSEDLALRANDILFVPDSTSKKAAARALEAVIQTVTGVVIWRGPRL